MFYFSLLIFQIQVGTDVKTTGLNERVGQTDPPLRSLLRLFVTKCSRAELGTAFPSTATTAGLFYLCSSNQLEVETFCSAQAHSNLVVFST